MIFNNVMQFSIDEAFRLKTMDIAKELDPGNEFDALSIESIDCIKRGLELISKIGSDQNALDDIYRAIVKAKTVMLLMHEIRLYSFVQEPVDCWLPPMTDESGSMSQAKSPNILFGVFLTGVSKEVLCMKAGKSFLDLSKEILSKYDC